MCHSVTIRISLWVNVRFGVDPLSGPAQQSGSVTDHGRLARGHRVAEISQDWEIMSGPVARLPATPALRLANESEPMSQ
jgi:hypothetical protein